MKIRLKGDDSIELEYIKGVDVILITELYSDTRRIAVCGEDAVELANEILEMAKWRNK